MLPFYEVVDICRTLNDMMRSVARIKSCCYHGVTRFPTSLPTSAAAGVSKGV